jgi:hypothetical protein
LIKPTIKKSPHILIKYSYNVPIIYAYFFKTTFLKNLNYETMKLLINRFILTTILGFPVKVLEGANALYNALQQSIKNSKGRKGLT